MSRSSSRQASTHPRVCWRLSRICGKGQKLALIPQTRRHIDREITMMKLINDQIGGRLHAQDAVRLPTIGACLPMIDDGTAASIHAHSGGKNARSLTFADVESIKLVLQIAFYGDFPHVLTRPFHLYGLGSLEVLRIRIDSYDRLNGSVERENSLLRTVRHLIKDALSLSRMKERSSKCC